MLLPISCGRCRHSFKVDSAFVGTVRKCPSCGFRFLMDNAVAEKSGVAVDQLRGQKVGCSECLRTFIPMVHPGEVHDIPCRFCDHRFEYDEGLEAYDAIHLASKTIRTALLQGHSDEQILRYLHSKVSFSNSDSIDRLLALNSENLPFLRHEVLVTGGRETSLIRPRPYCDTCGDFAPDEAVEVTWRLTQKSIDTSPFAVAVRLLVFRHYRRLQTHMVDKKGIHFLCHQCLRPMRSWWKTFKSRFVENEYVVHELDEIELVETENGTSVRYV